MCHVTFDKESCFEGAINAGCVTPIVTTWGNFDYKIYQKMKVISQEVVV